jgi:hypothetical protein
MTLDLVFDHMAIAATTWRPLNDAAKVGSRS